ncbi:MAG: hypothetical protein IJ688_13685 [Treponema sp.]|nr:hypothetical protein [Treponema sp.]
MTRHILSRIIALLMFLFCLTGGLSAEIIYDKDFGFSLDIPEGFEMTDSTEDGMSILLTHQNIPVTLAIKIYYKSEYKSSEESLEAALNKLSAEASLDKVKWSGENCAVSTFSMNLDQKYSGWAVGAPVKMESQLVVLCYAPDNIFQQCQFFIISAINSLSIKDEFYNIPGIFTQYAFPNQGKKAVSARIGGKEITSYIDESDVSAADFLTNIEYSILVMYANHPKKIEAWERYYRMIYRDSFGRLADFSSQVHDTLYPLARQQNPENADIAYAQMLLSWVQGFHYKRADKASATDFTSLPAMLCGEGNDCDSRSMLLCVLLKSAGIDSIFLFSPVYSHAIAGAGIKAPGQTFLLKDNGVEYLMGETTANVTWGIIAQEHADRNKWVPVILP